MATIRYAGFAGENRALHPKLLPENVGTASRNQKPGRGDLRPWRQPLTVATVPAGRQTIYRMGRDVASDADYWLSWPGVVHAVRGFETGDLTERTYYTGDGEPKVTNNIMGLASAPYPTASRPLGIPAPVSRLTVTFTDPTAEQAIAGQPARTETLKAPRVVTGASVFEVFGSPQRFARVSMQAGHGIVAGDKVTVNIPSHPFFNCVDTAVTIDALSQSIVYRIPGDPPSPLTAVTGTVTLDTDTVFYPAVPGVPAAAQGTRQTRFYTYTYVSDWGWESPPAPQSNQVDVLQSSTVSITGFAPAPAGNHGINRIRIYRTQTAESGATEFFFLREIPYGTTTTSDDNRVLGELLKTTTRLPAPGGMTHLTTMWNGMLGAIVDGELRVCEAYVPYAWPIANNIVPPDSKAVALAVFGFALLVLTTGRPLLVQGTSPESLDAVPLEIPQACIAPRSVASMGTGVAWASNDGLCWYGAGGARILTAGLMTRDDWMALNPASMIGCMYEGLYLCSFDDGSGRRAFLIDPANPSGLYFLDVGYEAMHFDELQDQLYVRNGANVQRWDAGSLMTARARSKEFRAPKPTNFGYAEVTADQYPVTVHFDCVNLPPADVSKLVAAIPFLSAPSATSVRYTATVTSRRPFTLPSGWSADDFQIEVSTTGAVQGVAMASSLDELKQA